MQASERQPLRGGAVLFLGLVTFGAGQTVLFALMGPVARDIGMREWQVGAIISAAAAVFLVASPIWGRLSDRLGRKPVIVFGLTAYAATTLLFVLTLHAGLVGWIGATAAFALLLSIRILYAALGAGVQPAAVAYAADMTRRGERSAGVSLVSAGFGLGAVAGPAVAALFVTFGVLAPLLAAGTAALVAALLILARLQEPERVAHAPTVRPPIAGIAPYLIAAFSLFMAMSALQQTAAFYIQDFTRTSASDGARLAGFAFLALAVATLVVQGGLVQVLKPSPGSMLRIGAPLAIVGVAVYALAPSYPMLLAGFALMGAGFGLAHPGIAAEVSLAAGERGQGGAAGLVQAAQAGGFVVGPLAGAILYPAEHRAPMVLAVVGLAVATSAALVGSRRRRRASEQPADAGSA